MLEVIVNDVWKVGDTKVLQRIEEQPGTPVTWDFEVHVENTQTSEKLILVFDSLKRYFKTCHKITLVEKIFGKHDYSPGIEIPQPVLHAPPDMRPRELKNLANWLHRGAPR